MKPPTPKQNRFIIILTNKKAGFYNFKKIKLK